MECVIGVDLGGTNVRAAAIDRAGNTVGPRVHHPSHAREGSAVTIEAVAGAIEEASKNTSPLAIGIAIPGHIDATNGTVLWAPNFGETINGEFQMWTDIPILTPLQKRTSEIIVIANDANAAALGEYRYGVGKGSAGCLVLWTLGTGIGSGVVLGPHALQRAGTGPSLVVGANGGAVELGHTTLEVGGALCSCGAYGCVEAYCGTPGLMKIAKECGCDATTPEELHKKADDHCESAIAAWRKFGGYLGAGIGNSINTFAPDIVAVAGKVAMAWQHFEGAMHAAAERQSIPSMWQRTTIVPAQHADDAGILGAAALAWEAVR